MLKIQYHFVDVRSNSVDHFVANYCPKLKLVTEVDRPYQLAPEAQARGKACTEVVQGYSRQVVRFSVEEVMRDFKKG